MTKYVERSIIVTQTQPQHNATSTSTVVLIGFHTKMTNSIFAEGCIEYFLSLRNNIHIYIKVESEIVYVSQKMNLKIGKLNSISTSTIT